MYYPRSFKANVTISQLMHVLGRAVRDLLHSRSGLMTDKALGFASCALSATRPLLSCCKSRTALRARINYNIKFHKVHFDLHNGYDFYENIDIVLQYRIQEQWAMLLYFEVLQIDISMQ